MINNNRIVINLKHSALNVKRFKQAFPAASFWGSTVMGKKGKSYIISAEEYNANKEILKQYGSKAREQPFNKPAP